jgi:hypothetical protein
LCFRDDLNVVEYVPSSNKPLVDRRPAELIVGIA